MGEVVRFIPKSDLDRVRLIREARAIYERIFPPADPVQEQRDDPRNEQRGDDVHSHTWAIGAIIVGPLRDTSISTSIAVCHSGRSDSFSAGR